MRTIITLVTFGIVLTIDTAIAKQYYPPPMVDPGCACGETGDGVSNRIVGGVITKPHLFPWIVAIFNKKALHCGGALINDRYVLTAGHCVRWTNYRNMDVGLGMHDLKDPYEGYVVPIQRVILHSHFESDFLHDTNDIALLGLQYPVKYSATIRPICLPSKGSDYTGRMVEVAGWGRIAAEGVSSRYLRKARLRVMSFESCQNTTFGDHLTQSMLCAYADQTDACQGDSGGPLLYQRPNGIYETIGIVSWGIGCAQPKSPGIYVKVSDYLNWIKAKTQDSVYCSNS